MLMETIFTPNEAAAFVELPTKKVYKELEYKVLPVSQPLQLPFAALIYLCVLKDVNFEFSVDSRTRLYKRLVEALEQKEATIEVGKFFILQLGFIIRELSEMIARFNAWKNRLIIDPNIMGGETVFPNSRLTVRHIGAILDRGESPEVIREDYPYLSEEDIKFAQIYIKAYPSVGRPRKH
ncbi:hypothetical protein Cylst_4534 [Cylindrospermum stagnale PCC 7417]|uniref:DUF433 domain-containing protein n=1 Tax=Cylindrospermum stagnale PCC 7417 TaxID=56107 RepID=K9X4P1_9NOST|nr:DUF433 domain-containing protein [Cylindrospermum stagnale]AFZ26612.1 hypothetical protein Cylst_4534 [Cylindrospermum stagnale PCC 7417]